jgi:hypothetical protein
MVGHPAPREPLNRSACPQVGDIIASFNGIGVNDPITLVGLKSKIRVGDSVRLRRGSWELQLSMTAGVR